MPNDVWRLRFLVIWSGQALSLTGSAIVQFALIWWLTKRTGSAASLAIASFVSLLPVVVIGPFAGALMDRVSRRWAMVVADALVAFFTALLVPLFWFDSIQPWHVYLVLFFRAVASAIHGPAMTSSTSLMVPNQHLTRVAGINQAFQGALRLVPPPLGAFLIIVLPMETVVAVDVVTALVAIVPLLFIAIPQPVATDTPSSPGLSILLGDMTQGLLYLWGRRELFLLITTASLVDFFTMPALSFLPLLVSDHFGKGPLELGWLFSIQGGGMIAGGLILSAWGGFKRRLLTCLLGWAFLGLGALAIGLAPSNLFWLAMGGMLLIGITLPIGSGPLTALLQSTVSPEMQGRFFSLGGSLSHLIVLLGLVAGGMLGDILEVQLWWVLMGLGHVILAAFWLLVPAGRRFEMEETVG